MYDEILTFWFEEIDPKLWWQTQPEFDALIKKRFLGSLQSAINGKLSGWRRQPEGRLAEIVILDQFSRNIFRNTPQAFAQDQFALSLAEAAVAAKTLDSLSPQECSFLLMPYMHSESRQVHRQAETLFRKYTPAKSLTFELRHKAIIDRFGRYPHRNRILGRVSSAEEIAFLEQPGSSF